MSEVKYAKDKPKECKYCFLWGGRKIGCTRGEENCYYIIKEKKTAKVSPCDLCPYGKNYPCIGFCMKKVMEKR